MAMLSKARLLLTGLALAFAGITQAAPTIFAYNMTGNRLISFDAVAPETLSSDVALTGLAIGEVLIGIDYRPATGTLYSVAISSTTSRVVTINPVTGAITTVGVGFTPLLASVGSPAYGIDFNPVPDRIRVVNSAGLNIRLNPNDGSFVATDTPLAYVPGDPGIGQPLLAVSHVAYSNNFAGTSVTTLYGIDYARDVLVRIGGVDGTPSPNTGAVTTIGALGVATTTAAGGFDIEAGTAFAVFRRFDVSNLYRVNLATGAATLVGTVGGAAFVNGIAIAPAPATLITATTPTGSTVVLPEYFANGPGSSSSTLSFGITGGPGQLACAVSGAGFTAAPNPLNLTPAGPNLVTVTYSGTIVGTFTGTLVCTPVSSVGGPFTYSLRAAVAASPVQVPALGNISLMLLIAGFLGLGIVLVGRRQA